jgi:acetolactate synthase-1/2/3 large subunit
MDTDHAKIAQAFGCEGIRVEKPQELAPAVRHAVASRKPTVIDVIIQREEGIAKLRGGLARRR